jgi:hypothetical protein
MDRRIAEHEIGDGISDFCFDQDTSWNALWLTGKSFCRGFDDFLMKVLWHSGTIILSASSPLRSGNQSSALLVAPGPMQLSLNTCEKDSSEPELITCDEVAVIELRVRKDFATIDEV